MSDFFSNDVSNYRMTPRTMQTSRLGPYAKLHIPRRRSRIAPVLWMMAYGVGIGVLWYVLLLVKVK